jgi:hypothetical protein
MLKVVAIATLGFGLTLCVGNVAAGEMAMPASAAFAPVGASSGDVETATAATRTETGSTGAMRESGSRDEDTEVATAARVHMQPDSVAATRTDSTHAAVGAADTAAPGTVTPAHKTRHSAHWQSLLPGVMK